MPLAAVNSLNPGNSILDFDGLLVWTVASSISASCMGEVGHEERIEGSNFSGGRVMGGVEDLDAGIDSAWMWLLPVEKGVAPPGVVFDPGLP